MTSMLQAWRALARRPLFTIATLLTMTAGIGVATAVFLRWRPDKPPSACRYDQLEVTKPYELEKVFGAVRP